MFQFDAMQALLVTAAHRLQAWLHQPDGRRWLIVIMVALLLHVMAINFMNRILRLHPPVRTPIFMLTHVVVAAPQAAQAPALTQTQTPAQTTPQRQAAPPAWLLAVSDAPLRMRTGTARTNPANATQPETTRPPVAGQDISSYSPTASAQIIPPNGSASHINNPQPQLPEVSRALGESGQVVVRVLVGANGHPQQVRMLHSSGFDRLDRIALETVRQWRFEPDIRSGQAQAKWLTLPVDFALQ